MAIRATKVIRTEEFGTALNPENGERTPAGNAATAADSESLPTSCTLKKFEKRQRNRPVLACEINWLYNFNAPLLLCARTAHA